MHSSKSTPVIGQVLIIFCFVVAAAVLVPLSGGSGAEPDRVDPSFAVKTTFASIKVDTASGSWYELVAIPVLIRNDVKIGQFQLEVDFPHQSLCFVDAEMGEALSEIDWEDFTYRLEPSSDTLYRVVLSGTYDIPEGYQGVPLAPNSEYVELVVLNFVIGYGDYPSGTFFPISFEWEASDCLENTLQDSTFDTLYVSQDSLQFNFVDCPPESLEFASISSSAEFLDGGVFAFHPSTLPRGDINANWVAYEVADLMLFYEFLLYGPAVLHDPQAQTQASDVNADSLYWSVADFLYLLRVILHDSPEIPGKAGEGSWQENIADQFRLVSSSTHPSEVVSVPIWLSNSTNAWGTTFRFVFDGNLLSVEGVDTSQTRIEEWKEVTPVLDSAQLFFFAISDWNYSGLVGYPSIGPGEGVLIRVNFQVDESAPPGTALPITFETEVDWGHYNAYTDSTGLNFVQTSTVSGWIYTDVISGDANSDGIVDAADLVYLINYLYRGKWPPSPESLGDFNQDGEVDAADVVALLNYLYGG